MRLKKWQLVVFVFIFLMVGFGVFLLWKNLDTRKKLFLPCQTIKRVGDDQAVGCGFKLVDGKTAIMAVRLVSIASKNGIYYLEVYIGETKTKLLQVGQIKDPANKVYLVQRNNSDFETNSVNFVSALPVSSSGLIDFINKNNFVGKELVVGYKSDTNVLEALYVYMSK